MSFASSPGALLDAASGALLLALGISVAMVRPRLRINVVLAAFSTTVGVTFIGINVVTTDDATAPFLFRLAGASALAAIVCLVLLMLRFPRPLGADRRRVLPLAAGLAGALAVVSLAFLVASVGGSWRYAGPYYVFAYAGIQSGFWFAMLLLPLRYAAASGADAARERQQCALLAGALCLYPAYSAGTYALYPPVLDDIIGYPGLVAVVAASLLWLRNARGRGAPGPRVSRNLALLMLGLALAGMAMQSLAPAVALTGPPGAVRTLTVLILAYAILKHQLLGLEVKLRWTIGKSTIAAVFVAVFFVVSEMAQQVFSGAAGPMFGIAAAGALVFALAPLQRFAERVADAAVPHPVALPPSAKKAEVYRAMVSRLLADGSLSDEDERALAHLAQELGIGAGDALDLKRAAQAERRSGARK